MMPNNVSILAYIQAMKDRTIDNIQHGKNFERTGGVARNLPANKLFLQDLENLEKFIKGGK